MLSQDATYGKIIPTIDDGRFDGSCKNPTPNCALRQKINSNPNMAGVASNFDPDQMEDVRLYLRKVRDAEVNGSSASIARTAVDSSTDATVSFTVSNYRATSLNHALTIAPGGSSEFTIRSRSASAGCTGSVPAAPDAASPTTCTVSAVVRFQPLAVGAGTTAKVRLTLAPPSASDPSPPVRDITLLADSFPPFTNSATELNFTTTIGNPLEKSLNLGNSGGTNITITGLALNPDATAAGYRLAPTNGCVLNQSLVPGGSCSLKVVFDPPTVLTSTTGATLTVVHSGFGGPVPIALKGVATILPRAAIELSPAAPLPVEAQVGSNGVTQTIVVHNAGDAQLQFSAITLSGTAAADFTRGGTCSTSTPLSVGPASNGSTSCTIELTFRPSLEGARNATLTIDSNAIIGSIPLALSGTGVPVPAPVAALSAAQLDFGSQTVNGLYPARSLTLTNTGNAALSISSLVLDGTGFSNTSATPCPASLAAGASCTIDIRFTPTAAGTNYASTLRVSSNAAGSPHSVTLVGRGTATAVPVLEWTAPAKTELDFGLVSAGTVSATQSVSFINRGPGGVTLSIINAIGTDAAAFAVDTSTCPVDKPLFQDTPCRVDIKFSPGSGGTKTAMLQIVSSGSAPATLKLTGTGLGNPAAGLALSTSTMVFEAIRLGAQSVPVELTLSGTGTGAVTVTGLQVSGPFSLQRKTCAAPPFQLNAGSSCTMTVTFQPQAEGSASGTLRVTSDAMPALSEIALNGSGQAQAKLSSGGCSIASGDTPFDPTLWALVLLAIGAIVYRRRVRAGRKP